MATELPSQLVMQARMEQLPDLEHWVARLGAEQLLSPVLMHRIDLCLTELVSNVIHYGYPDGKPGTVRIRFRREPERIVICMEDDGTPFDPTAYVPAGLPTSLPDADTGGRGIRLVRHFADELHHLASAAGNQLTLVFRSPRPARAADRGA
jgi:anti-sigma regulatory factor (Ser/Thr protein kinase)